MSYVRVFKVLPNGDVVSTGKEARNNHGFAPLVWEWLGVKKGIAQEGQYIMTPGVLEPLWAMFGKGKLERWEDLLMGATFDRVWIRKELIPELIEAMRRFHKEFVQGKFVETTYNLSCILEEILAEEPDMRGVAFNCCSANSPFWSVEDEETGEVTPYNVDTQKPESPRKTAWELGEVMNDGANPNISE